MRAAGYCLRPFNEGDAPQFVAAVVESMGTVGRWMSWAHSGYSERDALAWFAFCDAARDSGTAFEFGIFREADTLLVGGAGLNQFNWTNGFCNLGYWVRESAQRRGAATAAARLLSLYAFAVLNQTRVEIVVAAGNEHSLGVAKNVGATHECLARNRLRLHGEPVDAHVFALVPPVTAVERSGRQGT